MNAHAAISRLRLGKPAFLDTLSADRALYCIALYCFCFRYVLNRTNIDVLIVPVDYWITVFELAVPVLLLTKAIRQRYEVWHLPVILLFGIAFAIPALKTGNLVFLWLWVFVVAGQDVDIRSIAKTVLAATATILVCCVGLWFFDAIEETSFERADNFEQQRYSMGFDHPNAFGMAVLVMLSAWCTLRFPRFGIRELAVVVLGMLGVAYVSDSRTTLVSLLFLCVLFFVCSRLRSARSIHVAYIVCAVICLGCAVFSLWFMSAYDPSVEWHETLDNMLSRRFYFANYYYQQEPVSFLGRAMDLDRDTAVTGDGTPILVDNAYCRIAINLGILSFCAIAVALLAGLVSVIARQRRTNAPMNVIVVGLTLMAVAGVEEFYVLSCAMNFFLLGLSSVLYPASS